MNTTCYSPPGTIICGAVAGLTVVNVPPTRMKLIVDAMSLQTASPQQPTIANASARELPPPRDGRYSFRDMMSVLDQRGVAAFEHQRQLRDAELRRRHERGEVSSLYFFRCLARMTQEQLADHARSRQAFISQLEQRRRTLTWKQASKLATVLGVRPEQLMEHANNGNTQTHTETH